MTIKNYKLLSHEQLVELATSHRQDHDDSSTSFFEPEAGVWRIEDLDPLTLGAFPSISAAKTWIAEEIAYFAESGDQRAATYQAMLEHGVEDPVIAGVSHDGAKLWDGYHRAAIAMVRGESLTSVVGYSDGLVPALSGEPRVFTQSQLEMMDIDILDKMAFGCNDGDIIELDPSEIVIKYPCDLGNPEECFRVGGMKWVRSVSFEDPIEVSIGDDGRKYLEDGHHRRFSAIKLGLKLKAEIEIKGNPVQFILRRQEASIAKAPKTSRRRNDLSDGPSL